MCWRREENEDIKCIGGEKKTAYRRHRTEGRRGNKEVGDRKQTGYQNVSGRAEDRGDTKDTGRKKKQNGMLPRRLWAATKLGGTQIYTLGGYFLSLKGPSPLTGHTDHNLSIYLGR